MKAQAILCLGALLLPALLAGCTPKEKPLPPDVITGLSTRFNENDPQGAAELFTDDGVLMSEFGDSVRGKAAIATFLKGELDKKLQYWVTSEGSVSVGNLGYDYGSVRVRDTSKGMDLESQKYLTVYHKVGNSWKIQRSIYNTNSLAVCTSVAVSPPDEENNAAKP